MDRTSNAVVVIAHGSRAAGANDAHRRLCADLGERLGVPVVAAFLELAEPGIGDAIDKAVAGGANRVVVHPFFLLPGNHTGVDIPAAIEAARRRHPRADLVLTPHLGADAGVAELVAASLARRLSS